MPNLIVNLNHVAALRQLRDELFPDPAAAAILAELAGAGGVALRVTEDRRHGSDRDMRVLRQVTQGSLLLGLAPTSEMMGLALDIKPDLVTLMPEKPEEATSEGGLDLVLDRGEIADTIATIRDGGIPVHLLVDPDPEQIKRAHRLNADGVQLHTGAYAGRASARTRDRLRDRLEDAAKIAAKLRLRVLAGGGLHYGNAGALGRIREIDVCVIGHSIVSRALLTGMETAVRDMLILLEPR
jgi:pyridoxine 5-phosphate synthase